MDCRHAAGRRAGAAAEMEFDKPTGVPAGAGIAMDGLRDFLGDLKRHGYARGNFLGLLNVLIGRRIQSDDGTIISNGITWRMLAEWLKRVRWIKEGVRELGLDPSVLPPRDRQRYWFVAIAHANVDSEQANAAGDRLGVTLRPAGYIVGPAPRASPVAELKGDV